MRSVAEAGVRGGTSDTLGIVDICACVPASDAAFTGRASATALNARNGGQKHQTVWRASNKLTNLGFALATLLARLRGALVFDGGGRSQEDASALRAGKSAILVVVVIITPRDIVWDQVPAIVRLVLRGLREGRADGRGDCANGRDGGTTRTVEAGHLVESSWGKIGEEEGRVRGELCAIVLDFERERGDRHRDGHLL